MKRSRILIIIDHYPLSPRAIKIRQSLIKFYGGKIDILAWNRNDEKIKEDFVIGFNQKIGYGNPLKKIINLIKFGKFLKKIIKLNDYKTIHAIDFELLLMSKIFTKQEIVYEVYDIKINSFRPIEKIRKAIEMRLLKKNIKGIILASPFFNEYYSFNNKNSPYPVITLNNKPNRFINETSNFKEEKKNNNKIVVGFIGSIRHKDILLNLIAASQNYDDIIIRLSGSGIYYDFFKDYISENRLEAKVLLTGKFDYQNIKKEYSHCDVIWAAYPNKNLNVKYAISNKFFESIIFNKNIIVSENTRLSDIVRENLLGYVVNPYSVDSINRILDNLTVNQSSRNYVFGEGKYWEDEENRLKNIYV